MRWIKISLKTKREFYNFKKIGILILETKDTRDGAIYGKIYKDAIGELEEEVHYSSPDGFALKGPNRGYIKSIEPPLPLFQSRKQYKIKVKEQKVTREGNIILKAEIIYKPDEVDFKDKLIKIELYRESAKTLIIERIK